MVIPSSPFRCDVIDPGAIAALRAELVGRFPALDVLINNAGLPRHGDMNQDRCLTDVTHEIDTNLSGPVRMVQQVLPQLMLAQMAKMGKVKTPATA